MNQECICSSSICLISLPSFPSWFPLQKSCDCITITYFNWPAINSMQASYAILCYEALELDKCPILLLQSGKGVIW